MGVRRVATTTTVVLNFKMGYKEVVLLFVALVATFTVQDASAGTFRRREETTDKAVAILEKVVARHPKMKGGIEGRSRAFPNMDKNNDKSLSIEEWNQKKLTEEEKKKAFAAADLDSNGGLSKAELGVYMARTGLENKFEKEANKVIDTQEKVLPVDEIKKILGKVQLNENDEGLKKILDEHTKDGKVEYNEFIKAVTKDLFSADSKERREDKYNTKNMLNDNLDDDDDDKKGKRREDKYNTKNMLNDNLGDDDDDKKGKQGREDKYNTKSLLNDDLAEEDGNKRMG